MSLVLSLIAARSKDRLDRADIEAVAACLESCRARPTGADWLAAGEACDVFFEAASSAALAAVRSHFRSRRVDSNVVPADGRRKKLLLADMDSTIIEQECIDELAAEVGLQAEVAALTERAMQGEIGFEPALRARVALLAGLPLAAVERVRKERISFSPGAATLIETMRAAGAYTALVSGGFTMFTRPIADALGFDEQRANRLIESEGALTGEVAEPIFGRAAKEQALRDLAGRLSLSHAETLAIGDGANDLGMIRAAGLGLAYRAKPAVRAEADAVIDQADLTAVLFLQGFRRDEFVEAAAG
jgi:phosphoserine phosphatase